MSVQVPVETIALRARECDAVLPRLLAEARSHLGASHPSQPPSPSDLAAADAALQALEEQVAN